MNGASLTLGTLSSLLLEALANCEEARDIFHEAAVVFC